MRRFIAVIAFSVLILSCDFGGRRVVGNGNVETETRNVSRASKIKVLGGMDVYIDSGPASVKVEAESNLFDHIITDVDDNWLEIKLEHNINLTTHKPIKVYITTPNIRNIRVAGSGNVITQDKFSSDEPVSIDIAGSGDVKLDVRTPKVDADIAGSGNLSISGETKDVDVSIAGSGNFKGEDLKAENAKVKIAGSGDAVVFADVQLNAKLIGSGNVSYRGNAIVEKKVVGSGSVRKL
jgi:hypothetical protein